MKKKNGLIIGALDVVFVNIGTMDFFQIPQDRVIEIGGQVKI